MSENIFAWGHKNLNEEEGLEVLKQNIFSNQYLHSSYDYPGQFEYIKKISKKSNKKINLISKIYLDIPFYNMIAVGATSSNFNGLNRYGSLLFHTESVFNYFENNIIDLVLQICSIPKKIHFDNEEISNFLKLVNSKFKVNKIFIETFPTSEISSKKLMVKIQQVLEKNSNIKIKLGFAGYENIESYGFSEEIKKFIEQNKLMIMPIKVFNGKSKIKTDKFIKESLNYIEELTFYKYFFKAVTSTSNLTHYKSLKIQNDIFIKNPLFNKENLISFSYSNKERHGSTPYKINYDKYNMILSSRRFLTLIKALVKYPKFLKSLKKTSIII